MDSTEAPDPSLDRLFDPGAIALVGASADPEKLAGRPYRFLRESGYDGDVHLVNPNRDEIDGARCYDSVTEVPDEVDLALVLVPASVVADAVEDCGRKGIPYAVVIASGFAETGEDGRERQAAVRRTAREHGVRLVGPNSEGVVNLDTGVAASFSSILKRDDLAPGNVGFVSQSGAFGGAVFQVMQNLDIGASKWITTGNEADVDALDLMEYLVEDPETDVIATYVESLDDGRRLLRVGRRAAETGTAVVAMRVGVSDEGQRATASHTGSIASDDDVYDAVFEQAGVTRVRTVDEFSDAVTAFSVLDPDRYPAPDAGVGVLSMSGGAAALIADTCASHGVPLASLSEETTAAVRAEIPAYGSATNPVDVTGAAISDPSVFERCVTAVGDDPAVGALVLQYGNSGRETIEVSKDPILSLAREGDVPVATVFTGGEPRESTKRELQEAGVLSFNDPARAVDVLGKLRERSRFRAASAGRERPPGSVVGDRRPLSTVDWAAVTGALADAGVRFAPSTLAGSAEEAVDAAAGFDGPAALKLDPAAVAHKSDVGGVRTDLRTAAEVREAYEAVAGESSSVLVQRMVDGVELVVGVVDDDDFGPVMSFGPGGVFVELFEDAFSYRALPVSTADAREMVEASVASRLLEGYRDVPAVDADEVASLLASVSDAYRRYDVDELELNPVIASGDDCFAVDVLVN